MTDARQTLGPDIVGRWMLKLFGEKSYWLPAGWPYRRSAVRPTLRRAGQGGSMWVSSMIRLSWTYPFEGNGR